MLEHFFREERRRHGGGPARVKREVGDQLNDLVSGDPVMERAPEMTPQLLAAIERHQRRNGDEAAVTLGESRPFPDITEEHLLREIDELRSDGAYLVARGGRGCRCCRHAPSSSRRLLRKRSV